MTKSLAGFQSALPPALQSSPPPAAVGAPFFAPLVETSQYAAPPLEFGLGMQSSPMSSPVAMSRSQNHHAAQSHAYDSQSISAALASLASHADSLRGFMTDEKMLSPVHTK